MNIFAKIGTGSRFLSSQTYRSAISLQNLYPNSTLKLTTPANPPNDPSGKFNGYIPMNELDVTYSRSSGPGGQNVNKVNTKVEVRFKIENATWISPTTKQKLADKLETRLTKEGFAIFRSDVTRSQQLNLADCLEKIRILVRSCETEKTEPSEETLEKVRRQQEKASKLRLSVKRERSRIKADRQSL